MKKFTFFKLLLCSIASFANPVDDPCSYGVTSENSGAAVNIATGGAFEYAGAADFIVPFGTTFTVNQVKLNILKGDSNLSAVNVKFWTAAAGFPNQVIQTFSNLVPALQVLAYNIEPGLSSYQITLNLPSNIVLQKGKYFIQISAIAGGEGGAWWEVTEGLNQSLGVFDYVSFDEGLTWGGSGYGDYVFSVIGSCADSGEVPANLGTPCSQGDVTNNHEVGTDILFYRIADDFIVPQNTTFYLTHFDMTVLSMGPGINNATINIRNSVNDAPGNILQSLVNIGPTQEQFFDYWPWTGNPPLVPVLKWYFDFAPIQLSAGKYFIDVVPNVYATEELRWEGTTIGSNGGYTYSSEDGGTTWQVNVGYNQVFNVSGFCETTLDVYTPNSDAGISYFPNPVEDVLNFSSTEQIKDIVVYNMLGQEMAFYNNPNGSVNMTILASGIYLLKVQLRNGQFESFKVLKK